MAIVKKARNMRHPMQDYFNRNYIGDLVDDVWFDEQNSGDADGPFFCHAIGCLDALDIIPAGSMVSLNGCWYDASFYERENTFKEVQVHAEDMRNLSVII